MMRVGDLAERTGLSVRTLHHYEAIGLLTPCERTISGHRLYDEASVAQLQRIMHLKQLGMSLQEIRDWLNGNRTGLLDAIRARRSRVAQQMQELHSVHRRLELIEERIGASDSVSVDDVLEALEAMTMFDKYYTKAQLETLEQRRLAFGEEQMRSFEREWPELIARMRDAQQRGADPHSEEVQALARRWKELIDLFTGGDPGIETSLRRMYQNEPSLAERNGMDAELMAFVQKAWTA